MSSAPINNGGGSNAATPTATASSSSSSSSPSSCLKSVCTMTNLVPIYGTERAAAVIKYVVEDFIPFLSNFDGMPMRAQIQRGQSQGLMLTLQCQQRDRGQGSSGGGGGGSGEDRGNNGGQTSVPVWVGVFFPPAFPSRPPQVAILLTGQQRIISASLQQNQLILQQQQQQQGSSSSSSSSSPLFVVAPNGAVRLDRLDCGANPTSLMDIFVSVLVMMDTIAPVVVMGGGGGGQSLQQQQQQAQVASSLSSAAAAVGGLNNNPDFAPIDSGNSAIDTQRFAAGAANNNNNNTNNIINNINNNSAALTPEQQRVHDLLVAEYLGLVDNYLAVRQETLEGSAVLAETEAALRREASSLQEELDLLQVAERENVALQSAIDAFLAGNNTNNTNNNNNNNNNNGTPTTTNGREGGGGSSNLSSPVDGSTNNNNNENNNNNTNISPTPIHNDANNNNNNNNNISALEKITALDCIEPANELHGQALDLLASVSAFEDQLDFIEKCLAKRLITSDVYLRYVNTIARDEFQCRFLYSRAVDKLQSGRSLDALCGKFGPKGIDRQVVASVLAANSYNGAKTERALEEMVS